jgi:hypothetical protein
MHNNNQPLTFIATILVVLGTSASLSGQSGVIRGKPLNPTTTVIVDYVDGYLANGKKQPPPPDSGGGTVNHDGAHYVLIGGQWADADPLNGVVDPALTFVVDLRGFPAGADQAIRDAFYAWEVVTAGLLVDWDNSSYGPVDVSLGDGVNTYSMRNLGGGGVLASTYITWDDANANNTIDVGEQFLEMDVIHNSLISWGTDISIPPGKRWFDVQAVATHEIGHVFGLDHPAGHDADRRQTMYASIAAKDTSKRSLEADGDIPGIQDPFLGYGAP